MTWAIEPWQKYQGRVIPLLHMQLPFCSAIGYFDKTERNKHTESLPKN